jgi:hypothetical protein
MCFCKSIRFLDQLNNYQLISPQVPSNMNIVMVMFEIGFGSYDFILFPLIIAVIL